jgi:hypothetical protein
MSLSALAITIVVSLILLKRMRKLHVSDVLEPHVLLQEFVSRLRKLEQSMVDQRVRLEISELRQKRVGAIVEAPPTVTSERPIISEPIVTRSGRSLIQSDKEEVEIGTPKTGQSRRESADVLRNRVIDFIQSNGSVTAKQVQRAIGRSREHTSRMMNLLYKDGILDRDLSGRRYTYSLRKADAN